MARRGKLRTIAQRLAIATASAGMLLTFTGTAEAADRPYYADTQNGCASAEGTYNWYEAGKVAGKKYYDTYWAFNITNLCSKDAAMYVKYWKWNGSIWVDYTKTFHKIPAAGDGHYVADVQIFICQVGDGDSCGGLY